MAKNIEFFVATSNIDKFNSIKNLIDSANLSISIKQLKGSFSPPPESGKTPRENALLKAKYYSGFTGRNLITTDDGLFIKGASKSEQIGTLIKRKGSEKEATKEELFNYWHQRLSDGKILKAERIRSFVIIMSGKTHAIDLKLSINLKMPKKLPLVVTDKPLNYFMYPEGSKLPISDLNNAERIKFQNKSLKEMRSFLKKIVFDQ